MQKIFILQPGESKIIKINNTTHTVHWNYYLKHDHKNKPLYLEPPNPDNKTMVGCVESNPAGVYDSPYSGTIDSNWKVMRENETIDFERRGNSVKITISKKEESETTFNLSATTIWRDRFR